MFRITFVLLIAAGVYSNQVTPVKKCKGVTGDLFKTVTVSTPKGVCTQLPCTLYSGKNATADITFLVREEVKQISTLCNATVFGVTTPYPLPNADKGCDLLTNTKCPVPPGTSANLKLTMSILQIFPKVAVNLVFYLHDQNSKMISCFEFPAKVVDGRSTLDDAIY